MIAVFIIIIFASAGGEKEKITPIVEEPVKYTEFVEEEKLEKEYSQEMVNIFSSLSESATYLGDFLTAKPNPKLWTNEEVIKIAVHTITIQELYPTAEKLEPPDKFRQSHKTILSGLKKYREAMLIFPAAIDNLDVEAIGKATNLMLEGTAIIQEGKKQLEAL